MDLILKLAFPIFSLLPRMGCHCQRLVLLLCVCEQDQRDKLDQSVEGGVKLHKGRPGTKAGQGPSYSHLALSILHPPTPLAEGIVGLL